MTNQNIEYTSYYSQYGDNFIEDFNKMLLDYRIDLDFEQENVFEISKYNLHLMELLSKRSNFSEKTLHKAIMHALDSSYLRDDLLITIIEKITNYNFYEEEMPFFIKMCLKSSYNALCHYLSKGIDFNQSYQGVPAIIYLLSRDDNEYFYNSIIEKIDLDQRNEKFKPIECNLYSKIVNAINMGIKRNNIKLIDYILYYININQNDFINILIKQTNYEIFYHYFNKMEISDQKELTDYLSHALDEESHQIFGEILKSVTIVPYEILVDAIWNENVEIVKLIKNHSHETKPSDAYEVQRNEYTTTPLLFKLITNFDEDIANVIKDDIEDFNIKIQNGMSALHYLIYMYDYNPRIVGDFTPEKPVLFYMKKIANIEKAIEFLMKSGFNIDIEDDNKTTPLIYACFYHLTNYNADLIKTILHFKPDVNKVDIYNNTALSYAKYYESSSVRKLLLIHNANDVDFSHVPGISDYDESDDDIYYIDDSDEDSYWHDY